MVKHNTHVYDKQLQTTYLVCPDFQVILIKMKCIQTKWFAYGRLDETRSFAIYNQNIMEQLRAFPFAAVLYWHGPSGVTPSVFLFSLPNYQTKAFD